jgi:hypothetical protein
LTASGVEQINVLRSLDHGETFEETSRSDLTIPTATGERIARMNHPRVNRRGETRRTS